ncbi:MAG: helicase-related protein [Kofleriaceae bacterium]
MNRPDVEAVLRPLKSFQRRTVDHAFHRLFVAPDSTARFLVADEVGLGKTLIARGIIARAVDHLWESVKRIDIVYICSNGNIARSNLPKLQIGGGDPFALATRLTMLPAELGRQGGRRSLADGRLNFVSFTPGTSFELGNASGHVAEREVLFRLLEPLVETRTPLLNLLQGNVKSSERWRRRVDDSDLELDAGITERFHAAFAARAELGAELEHLFERWFCRSYEWPAEARAGRNAMIGKLRQLLAEVCVEALEPDLVILDEFQRFKNLLDQQVDEPDPAAELAQELFHATTPEGAPVRTLLLSATPYKLYTADAEIEHEDHYADFLATTSFLMRDDPSRVAALKSRLSTFGAALKRAAAGDPTSIVGAKRAVEALLRCVMARTERVAASADRDAMVEEPRVTVTLAPADVHQYMAADALFTAVGDRDPMPFWISAPHLAHFMRGYSVNRRLDEVMKSAPETIAAVLEKHAHAFLDPQAIQAWQEVPLGNAKLRELASDLLDSGLWKLLWMPPTIPYWPLEGPFASHERRTKTLLFSAWNVVPDVVCALLSYEAERRMTGGRITSYADPKSQQGRLLVLTQSAAGVRARHRLLLLLLPCLALADEGHPLAAPAGADRRAHVRGRVESLLSRLPDPAEGDIDHRWEWAAPLLLDEGLQAFVRTWAAKPQDVLPRPDPAAFAAYADDVLSFDPSSLGRRPEGLAALLTDVALGSPAVLAARTLAGCALDDGTRRALAVTVADAFWRLFNRPSVVSLLQHLEGEAAGEDAYWRVVLRYCRGGNLQAVLDETWHLMWEQHSWSGQPAAATADRCARELVQVIEPKVSRVHARFLRVEEGPSIGADEVRLRTDFAIRFGDVRTDDESGGSRHTQDAVRASFNSPFRPFVLASTSVGQEGLDFHPWCHRLVHWNLPGNPVDLEQREGRVHRYKGHAIRRNVATECQDAALRSWTVGADLWAILFELATAAARARGDSDLVPHWIAPGPYRVLRHVPTLPYTKEVEAFRRLKRQLAAYRVVFGQPRQEELVTLLAMGNLHDEVLRTWAIDLQPPPERDGMSPSDAEGR